MRCARWSAVLAGFAMVAAALAAEPPGDGDLNPLIGYWSLEQEFPAPLVGILNVTREGDVWRGRRIVDASWIERSTAPMAPISPETTGYSAEEFGEYYAAGVDGYAWHSYGAQVGDRIVTGYQATGNGGQVLIVVPEYDLVVVFMGGNYMQGGIWGQWGNGIVGGAIIPAIRD